jgi:hypothetical protein
VSVLITGTGFDPTAAAQVQLSGPGISVGPLTVTTTTIACDFIINAVTAATARDVTVKMGLSNSTTLPSGFTVV